MTWHPEQFDRGSDRQPYDPDEPLVVRWADVVAARNAAQALLVVLKDAEVDLEATSRVVGWQVRDWLPTSVSKRAHEPLGSQAEVVEWLKELVCSTAMEPHAVVHPLRGMPERRRAPSCEHQMVTRKVWRFGHALVTD
jgi:hypothetical protein